MTFMESLVLRHALNALRGESPPALAPSDSGPDTIAAFLERVGGPAMARHVPTFAELGVDVVHLPVLARLDAESYGEFEEALIQKGLTWVERFLVRDAKSLAKPHATPCATNPIMKKALINFRTHEDLISISA